MFLRRHVELGLSRNPLGAPFLRKLEYYDGVLFLTTDLVHQFDDAILDRIHLVMEYDKLGKDARKTTIVQFLDSVNGGRGLSNIDATGRLFASRPSIDGAEQQNCLIRMITGSF